MPFFSFTEARLKQLHLRPLSYIGWILSAAFSIVVFALNLTATGWMWGKIDVSSDNEKFPCKVDHAKIFLQDGFTFRNPVSDKTESYFWANPVWFQTGNVYDDDNVYLPGNHSLNSLCKALNVGSNCDFASSANALNTSYILICIAIFFAFISVLCGAIGVALTGIKSQNKSLFAKCQILYSLCLLISFVFTIFGVGWTASDTHNVILQSTFWQYFFCGYEVNGKFITTDSNGNSNRQQGFLAALISLAFSLIAGVVPILSMINKSFDCCLFCFINSNNLSTEEERLTYTMQKRALKNTRNLDDVPSNI